MSSHDCRIRGQIQMKEGVTRQQIEKALSGFLEHHDLGSPESLEANDEFNFKESAGELWLDIRFYGHGGYRNEPAEELRDRLAELSIDGEYFELFDDDTGDDDARCTPYFLAAAKHGQIEYGIREMQQWIEPLVGRESFSHLADSIRAATKHLREGTPK